MKLFCLVLFIFLSGCSHQKIKKDSAKANPSPPHPCFTAVVKNDLDYVQKNLSTCRDVKTSHGTTILMLAAAKGRDQIINYLLESGFDVNQSDDDLTTPISYAVVTNQLNTVNLLILSGASLETKRPDGVTVLMQAIQIGTPQMVNALLATREAINYRAEDGSTPLYFAITRKDPSILALLLRSGACKNIEDQQKQTPLQYAQEIGWKQGVSIIESAPACGNKKKAVGRL